jgi:hypothetical protein
MVAVDTLTLPGASIIVYNNWPRVPTATPAFIARYCQIEDPYKEGGLPMKVEVIECPAAESRGYPCSCGFINFVGWNWLGSNANIWDSSVVNGDDLALTFALHDKKGSKVNHSYMLCENTGNGLACQVPCPMSWEHAPLSSM